MSTAISVGQQDTLGVYRGSEQRAGEQPVSVPLRSRIMSLDIIRGVVMVLMAIDHVRVYSGLPAGGPTPGIFFTRWVTNFCAPAFVFLAGTGAFLHGEKLGGRRALARFLVTRGAWLVLLELTLLRASWTFNFDYAHYVLAGVIWMLGWCMILMGGLIYLPRAVIAAFAVVVIAGHDLVDGFLPVIAPALQQSSSAWIWQLLYFGGPIKLGEHGPVLAVLYSIIPWIGVMAAGYAFGPVMRMTPGRRRSICLRLGGGAVLAFLLLRGFDIYGDPRPWNHRPALTQRAQPTPAPSNPSAPSNASAPINAPAPSTAATPGNAPPAAATAAAPGTANRPLPSARPGQAIARPRRPMPRALAFLSTNKYPASLLFLLMTLGPLLIAVPLLEHARGRVARVLSVYGKVPLFYYLLHIPLIHFAAVLISLARTGAVIPWLTTNHPMMNPPAPAEYVYSLALLYIVTIVVVTVLYFPCRWFAELKSRRRGTTWLSFL